MQEIILEIRSFKRWLSKSLKKVNFLFFLSNPVPFNEKDFEKQKGPGTRDHSFFRLRNKLVKIPSLMMYYLTKFDDVYEVNGLLSYSKNYVC